MVEYAQVFSQEANSHRKASKWWLGGTVLLAILTVALAWIFYKHFMYSQPQLSAIQAVQLSITKIVILSVLLSATLWTGKIFRANQHNYVVNKHRHNALRSFETFVKSAGADLDTKNAVLVQATKCVFSPQPSGYFSQDSEPVQGPQILEIFRSLSGK